MSTLLGTFDVLNRTTGKFESANLFRPIGQPHARDFETHWRPAFRQRLARMAPGETYESAQLQDAHWEWPRKSEVVRDRLDFDSFAVVIGGITQGLAIVNLTARSRLPSQTGQHLVYVELVATAPWNRHGFAAVPVYKGIGRLLVAAVISLSVDQEFDGRYGLHAIPQSVDWYRSVCGMTELGPDPAHPGMIYFEATAAQARAFIS